MEIHIKIKGKAACGQKKIKRPLLFASIEGEHTCKRCKRVVAK
jgi:hypothetical protein